MKDLLPNARSLISFYWNDNHGQVNVKYSDTARSIQKWLFNSFQNIHDWHPYEI